MADMTKQSQNMKHSPVGNPVIVDMKESFVTYEMQKNASAVRTTQAYDEVIPTWHFAT
jgi:hypothetical protein